MKRRLAVLAVLALASSLAGGACAAVLVGSKQVRDESLTGRDLRGGAVRSIDVKNDSLTAADFAVPPKGPQGDQGPPGEEIPGDHGLLVKRDFLDVPASTTTFFPISCDGLRPINGGIKQTTSPVPAINLVHSAPTIDGTAWVFAIESELSVSEPVEYHVVCGTER